MHHHEESTPHQHEYYQEHHSHHHQRHRRSTATTTMSLFVFVLCRMAVTLAVLSRSGSWSASALTPGSLLPTSRRTLLTGSNSRSCRTAAGTGLSSSSRTASIIGGYHDDDLAPEKKSFFDRTTLQKNIRLKRKKKTTTTTTTSTNLPPISKIDTGTFWIHFCAAVTMTLPVMIVPMMDAELFLLLGPTTRSVTAAATALPQPQQPAAVAVSLAAMMATWAPLGNGIGKLVNGVVCQALGGQQSSKLYFMGSTLFSMALACLTLGTGTSTGRPQSLLTPQSLGYIVAGMEFCASIQWTVCSLFLSQHHRHDPAAFARGITLLSLSSTTGQISAKVIGACLLQHVHWRWVARLSVVVAILGWNISRWTSRNMVVNSVLGERRSTMATNTTEIVDAAPVMKATSAQSNQPAPTIRQSVGRVLSSKIFWMIGLAHVSGYLTRTSDRILGTFLQEITLLSRKLVWDSVCVARPAMMCLMAYLSLMTYLTHTDCSFLDIAAQVCGGLTAFMTVGFLFGLVRTSSKFHQTSAHEPKLALLRNGYIRYLLSAGGLIASAAFGKQWHPYVSASVITFCASVMASSIAFPFFQGTFQLGN